LSQAQNLFKINGDEVTEIVIEVGQPEQAKEAADNIAAKIEEKGYQHEIYSWEQLAPELMQFVEMERGMMGIVALVVIVIATVGILNTMSMVVYERVKEIGVLAAFGYKRRDILLSFLLEGLIIGLIGAVIGCILGICMTQYLSITGIEMPGAAVVEFMDPNVYPRLTIYDVSYPFFLAVCITLVAALYPAYKASRMEPVEALRHV
jgi:putative ABC transport system permease protein